MGEGEGEGAADENGEGGEIDEIWLEDFGEVGFVLPDEPEEGENDDEVEEVGGESKKGEADEKGGEGEENEMKGGEGFEHE